MPSTMRHKVGPAIAVPVLVVVILVSLGVGDLPRTRAWALATNGLLILASTVVATCAHEAAHAFVARGLGLQPTAVVVGRGRPVWQAKWHDVRLALGLVPFTGLTTITAPSLRFVRPKLMAIYAAGPLANVALAMLALSVPHDDGYPHLARSPAPLLSFLLVNVGMAVTNMIPQPGRKNARPGSDGYNFLSVPFWKHSRLTAMMSSHRAWQAARLAERGRHGEALAVVERGLTDAPTHLGLRVMRAGLLVLLGLWSDAASHLRELIADRDVTQDTTILGLLENDLAWTDFMLDDPSLLEEADRLSRQALERLRDHAAVHGRAGRCSRRSGAASSRESISCSLGRGTRRRTRLSTRAASRWSRRSEAPSRKLASGWTRPAACTRPVRCSLAPSLRSPRDRARRAASSARGKPRSPSGTTLEATAR